MRAIPRPARISALVLAAALAAGCSGVQKPTTRVASVRVVQQSREAARIVAILEVHNPNDVPLPLVRSRYRLTIEGGDSAALTDVPNRTLPPLGTQTVELPLALRGRGLAFSGSAFELSGSVTYEPPGMLREILEESLLPLPKVGFSATGRLR